MKRVICGTLAVTLQRIPFSINPLHQLSPSLGIENSLITIKGHQKSKLVRLKGNQFVYWVLISID
jgi:hypothetical protein